MVNNELSSIMDFETTENAAFDELIFSEEEVRTAEANPDPPAPQPPPFEHYFMQLPPVWESLGSPSAPNSDDEGILLDLLDDMSTSTGVLSGSSPSSTTTSSPSNLEPDLDLTALLSNSEEAIQNSVPNTKNSKRIKHQLTRIQQGTPKLTPPPKVVSPLPKTPMTRRSVRKIALASPSTPVGTSRAQNARSTPLRSVRSQNSNDRQEANSGRGLTTFPARGDGGGEGVTPRSRKSLFSLPPQFTCEQCPAKFTTEHCLTVHSRQVHTRSSQSPRPFINIFGESGDPKRQE